MLDYAVCPECCRRVDLGDEDKSILEQKLGREWEMECDSGHIFYLHDGILATKLQPSHYSVFWNIQGIESGRVDLRVGEWCVIRLTEEFDKIDEIKTICYPEQDDDSLTGVRSEAQFDSANPNEFWIMTSGQEMEWGKGIKVKWIVYGSVPRSSLDVWKENLIFAARQLLAANYRTCVIQSAVAVESFVYHFVKKNLIEEDGWRPKTVEQYIDGASRDSLSLQGVIRVCIEEIMGLSLSSRVRGGWSRLRKMRNALAHGELDTYLGLPNLDGQPFVSERDRADFAYRVAVRFIYGIRYPNAEENS
jgi:hypothetical protein